MTDLTGQPISHYHILEQLGEGGMAIVYKALDTRLEREVALKVIRTEKLVPATMDKTLKRFEREAKALAKLNHPHIVSVTDYGEQDGKPYLVMPYLPGGTLKKHLSGKPIPWQDAARLLAPIARALDYAHQQGIVHRDVKPSNILITQSGQPMLSDFGVAKILETEETLDLTGTGVGIGTPDYMAPEQGFGHSTDARMDVYALGVVFYEMVTGRRPYQADTPMAIMLKKNTEPLPRPTAFVPSLPRAVENHLIKALARDPSNRFQTMGEMAVSLDAFAQGKLPFIEPTTTIEIRPRKNWTIWIGAGLVGLLCLAALATGGLFAVRMLGSTPGSTPTEFVTAPPEAGPAPVKPSTPTDSFISYTPTIELPTVTPTAISSWQQGKLAFPVRNTSTSNFLHWLDLANSGEPQLLFTPEVSSSYLYAPWFSRDGNTLAYGDLNFDKVYALTLNPLSSPRLMGKCQSPSISPDGNRVICGVAGQNYFPVYDIRTGKLVDRIKHGTSGAVVPVWSPDGTEIAFSELVSEPWAASVWKVSVSGGNPTLLAGEANEDFVPSWSPDSEWIAFQSDLASEKSEVWVMRRDGSERRQITWSGEGRWSRGPCFSPDGQWLAFVSSQNESSGPDFGDVFVVSLVTGEIHQITHTGGNVYDFRVTWGP